MVNVGRTDGLPACCRSSTRQTRSTACRTATASAASMWSRARTPSSLCRPTSRSMRATRGTRTGTPIESVIYSWPTAASHGNVASLSRCHLGQQDIILLRVTPAKPAEHALHSNCLASCERCCYTWNRHRCPDPAGTFQNAYYVNMRWPGQTFLSTYQDAVQQ